MEEGWIKIYRKILTWEWHDRPEMVSMLVHLILLANFEDRKWHGTDVRRGELVTSLEKLSKDVGISVQQARTCLQRLIDSGFITNKSTNKYRIITICNYDSYQDFENANNRLDNKQATSNQQTNNKQATTTKELKNNNNIISSSTTRVRVQDIPKYMNAISGTTQWESVRKEIYRLIGCAPTGEQMQDLVAGWMDELAIQGVAEKAAADICRHFISWARIAIPAMRGRNTSINNGKDKDKNGQGYTFRNLPDNFTVDI